MSKATKNINDTWCHLKIDLVWCIIDMAVMWQMSAVFLLNFVFVEIYESFSWKLHHHGLSIFQYKYEDI